MRAQHAVCGNVLIGYFTLSLLWSFELRGRAICNRYQDATPPPPDFGHNVMVSMHSGCGM
jgi:hypothetical protein